MTIVLAGSRRHYQTFLEKLWSRDRSTTNYCYVNNSDAVRGLDRNTRVIKLGSFTTHPNYEEILAYCESRFDMNPRRRDRMSTRIVDGTDPVIAHINGVPDGRVYLRDVATDLTQTNVSVGEIVMSEEQSDRIRGLTTDFLVVDEPGLSQFSNNISHHVAQASRDMSRNIETQMIYGMDGRRLEHCIHIAVHTPLLGQIHDALSDVLSSGADAPDTIHVGYQTHHQLLIEMSEGYGQRPTDQFTLTTQAGPLNIIVSHNQPSDTIVFI